MAHAEVADIFRRYGPSYRETHKLPLHQLRTMHAIEICRTAELGGHVDECEECGHIKISYNSCRNRHCPKCQFLKKEKWVEARGKELLPIEYFHVVFTLPDELNPLALRNREVFYNILFKAASETLTELRTERLGVQIGFIARSPHVGAEPHGPSPPPLHRLGRRIVRGKVDLLEEEVPLPREGHVPALQGKVPLLSEKGLRGGAIFRVLGRTSRPFLNALYAKEWVVYAKPPFNGPETVLGYLGRYTHRIAITNHRIIGMEEWQGLLLLEGLCRRQQDRRS